MSGRDLLYKPQVPIVMPDDDKKVVGKKGKTEPAEQPASLRNRDLGQVGEQFERKLTEEALIQRSGGKALAYRNPYFNRDVGAAKQVNLRQGDMRALRGEAGAADLKKVVLPMSPYGVTVPDPKVMQQAGSLMDLDQPTGPDLGSLLQRHGTWSRGAGVTVEMLQARMRQLEQMVKDRLHALQRIQQLPPSDFGASPTVSHAVSSQGKGLEQSQDLAGDGTGLIQRNAERAERMHQRIAKILGLKKQSGGDGTSASASANATAAPQAAPAAGAARAIAPAYSKPAMPRRK